MNKFTRREVLAYACAASIGSTNAVSGRLARAADRLEDVSIVTPSGRTVSAVMAVPASVPAPAVVLVHGGFGLTDLFKTFAGDFARDGFLALAVDLYDGRIATDEATRIALRGEVYSNPENAIETIAGWIAWLKSDRRSNGKVGIVGWSFGAGWALEASIATPVEATVLYVGLSYPGAKRLARLKGPVLAHLGERDHSIGELKMFEKTMAEARKPVQAHWYAGDHFFPFPTRPSYDKDLADTAWTRTVDFLRANLK
jgi:carboxymethylenebutenolidase